MGGRHDRHASFRRQEQRQRARVGIHLDANGGRVSREQQGRDGDAHGTAMTEGSAGGLSSPGKLTITEQVPSTYVGPPSSGPTGPGKHTLIEAHQARSGYGPSAAVQASPAAKPTSPGDHPQIAPATPGIDKAGFIDHSEGSLLRTGPRELGAGTVRPEPLPPATRVFVSGTHPKAPDWWYVTAFVDKQLFRGYVQGPRVNTDLPEPLAELREVTGRDTAEGFAREKFGDAVTDGHDLRYYENVLLFVNQQRDRAGITGTYQDPGILGGGANNVQLVAGHRIWLVSAQYAKALQSLVPSGSLTGGAVAKVKRFAGHLEDILHSVTESRHHLDEVGGEYAQAIRDHEAAIVGIVAAFITAEAVSMFAAASPTGVGQAVAMVIQLALSAFGAAGMVEAGAQALEHGSAWLHTAWTAKGNKNQIALASKQFLKMLVSLAMAALSFLGARGNYRNLVKIGGSMPTGGLPAFATTGASGPGGAGAATGVAIGLSNPGGAFGTAMAMSPEGDNGGKTSPESSHDGKEGKRESSTQHTGVGQHGEPQLTAGKNFKEHFLSKKPLLERALGAKLGKLKEGGGEGFLKAISDGIHTGVFKYVGQGTLKKGMEAMNIYRGQGLTVVTKTNGEWVTLLQSGEGLDLAIRMVP